MWKHVWLGMLVAGFGIHYGLTQSFLDDQFQLLQPQLALDVFVEGNTDCNAGTGQGYASFECEAVVVNAFYGNGTDADGKFYQINRHTIPLVEPLCPAQVEALVFDIERVTSAGLQLVARVPECVFLAEGQNRPTQVTRLRNLSVDAVTGNLYVAVDSRVTQVGGDQANSIGIVRISGLPTLLDIIPTFQPASETLGWVTPKHPEALPSADRFMVYAGDIAALREDRDFTRAVPVDCQVPDVGVPGPGEFLSVLDPLQVEPSQTSYAIVGVEHQGRLRFGRQSMGGVLTGREAGTFSTCG